MARTRNHVIIFKKREREKRHTRKEEKLTWAERLEDIVRLRDGGIFSVIVRNVLVRSKWNMLRSWLRWINVAQ